MKMRPEFVSAFIIFQAFSSFSEVNANPVEVGNTTATCEPNSADCFYYQCLEDKLSCGNDEIPMEFYRLCSILPPIRHSFTNVAQNWMAAASFCVQEQFQKIANSSSKDVCQDLKTYAYFIHTFCWVNVKPSFCDVPFEDRVKLTVAAADGITIPGMARSAAEVLNICRVQRFRKFIEVQS